MPEATLRPQVRDVDAEMERLLAGHGEQNVFLRPVWLKSWLAEFGDGRQPVFLEARDDGAIAVAPLMRQDEELTFIGDSSICDYMDFLVEPGKEATAYAGLWERICGERWSELKLWGLAVSSPTRGEISDRARSAGYVVEEEEEAVAPRLRLPATWDDYLTSLRKKDRHELRRKMRRLYESGAQVRLDVLSDPDAVVAAMPEFFRLHTVSRHDKAQFMTERMQAFFRRIAGALAAVGLVRLFMLYLGDKPAASVLSFEAGDYLYMYNSGYDPEHSALSVGLLSKALCLRWAIENGKKGLDFLRGDEPYKYDLGASDQKIYCLTVRRRQ